MPAPAPRVVVTGLGFITSIGLDRETVTASLRAGRPGFSRVEWFPGCGVKLAGLVPDFQTDSFNQADWRWPEAYPVSRETLRGLSPHGLYAYCALEQALRDAALPPAAIADGRTGLFTASAGSPSHLRHHLNECAAHHGARIHPMGLVRSIVGTLSFNLAAHHHVCGAVTGFSSACAASAHALGYACDEIRLGRQERMLVVAAEEPTWECLLPFQGLRALSRAADPAFASRPFDRGRDGFVGAGGGVGLVLESAASAAERGAGPYAELAGWGQAGDGHSPAQSDPEGRGLARAMRFALADAQVDPTRIDYINPHATSTPVGDAAEALALRAVFGSANPIIGATKGITGHPLSMSGALEAALCCLALRDGFCPGNPQLREPDAICAGLNLPRGITESAPDVVLSNSSGFGGSNVALVLRRPATRH
jgi:3-oxoacyl-(acyl-carrier-protein) synthase